jgi:hypothetical protein
MMEQDDFWHPDSQLGDRYSAVVSKVFKGGPVLKLLCWNFGGRRWEDVEVIPGTEGGLCTFCDHSDCED